MTEAWVQSLFDEEPEVYGPKERPRIDPRDKVLADGTRYRRGYKGRVVGTGTDALNPPSASGNNPLGAPPLDWWVVDDEEEALQRVIRSMCPDRVCKVCGEPSRRIVETAATYKDGSPIDLAHAQQRRGLDVRSEAVGHDNSKWRVVVSESWSDCGHDDWRPGIVLDPFEHAS